MTDDKRNSQEKEEEISQFEKLATRTKELFSKMKEKSSSALEAALDKAKDEMVNKGDFTAEQGERLRNFLRRDIDATKADVGKVANKFRENDYPTRVGMGALGLIQFVAEVIGDTFKGLASTAAELRTYKTGEICGPGSLKCVKCGKPIEMKRSGHVPPCAGCGGSEFRRSY